MTALTVPKVKARPRWKLMVRGFLYTSSVILSFAGAFASLRLYAVAWALLMIAYWMLKKESEQRKPRVEMYRIEIPDIDVYESNPTPPKE